MGRHARTRVGAHLALACLLHHVTDDRDTRHALPHHKSLQAYQALPSQLAGVVLTACSYAWQLPK